MKRNRRPIQMLLSAVLFGSLCLSPLTGGHKPHDVYAAVTAPREPSERNMTEAELNGYSEERWAELMDNRLEYGEIDDLVHNFNPAIVSAWSNLNDNIRLMETITDNLKSRKRDMEMMKDSAISAGEAADAMNYAMQEIILEKSAHSMYTSLEKMKRPVTQSNRPLRAAERQVAAGAKQLMIAYVSLTEQIKILEDSRAMMQKLLEDANALLVLGLATQTDVQSANVSLLKLEAQLGSLQTTADSLKKNLILLCGWSENADPEIGPLPEPDLARIGTLDPDIEFHKAVANNGSIIDFHHEKHSISTASMDAREKTEEQMYENLLVNLRTQKQTILADRQAYEAAQSGMQAAEMTKNAADMQYQLGMLSTVQYLGSVTQYTQARTQLLTARNTLFQDMEQYEWMLSGSASVE